MKHGPIALFTAALAWLPAPSLAAAAPVPQVQLDYVDVELVHVELHVTDADGRPILDLRPEEVSLREDGHPVDLAFFDRIGLDEARSVTEERDARIVVFLDELHTSPSSRAAVYESLAKRLGGLLEPDDQLMVVRYDGRGVEILAPFSTDHEAALEMLRSPALPTAIQIQANLEEARALETIQQAQAVEKGSPNSDGACLSVGALAENYAETSYHGVIQTIEALTAFVNSMAGMPGRKMLLHVSDGLPLIAGGQAFQYAMELCDGSGAREGIPLAEDVRAMGKAQRYRWDPFGAAVDMQRFDTTQEWRHFAGHANAHQVSFYPLLAAGDGLRAQTGSTLVRTTQRTAEFGWRNRQDTLALLAELTGGTPMLSRGQIDQGMARMVDDAHRYYLLSYEPRPDATGEIRRIEVEVDRPGVRVRHRESYRAKDLDERIRDGLLTCLLYDEESNPLGAQVRVERSAEVGAAVPVRVRITLPSDRLALFPRDPSGRQGILTVYVVGRDTSGNKTPFKKKVVPVLLGEADGTYTFEFEMSLPSTRWQVAIALRDDLGRTTSFLREIVPPTAS